MEKINKIIERKQFSIIWILAFLLVFMFNSCNKNKADPEPDQQESKLDDIVVSSDFNWETSSEVNFAIKVLDGEDKPVVGVYIEVYDRALYLEEITETSGIIDSEAKIIFKGSTDNKGELKTNFSVATNLDTIFICPKYLGVERMAKLIVGKNLSYTFGGIQNIVTGRVTKQLKSISADLTLGTWDAQGVPNYLEVESDVFDDEFLADVNASLPESDPLPETHPQYLANGNETNLNLDEDAELWVTFIHEGARWKNVLGYYSYPTDNPPATADDITNKTIIFPNVSYLNGGGGLHSGNKVQFKYYDTELGEFVNTFPSGTTVGWFLVGMGWAGEIVDGIYTHYSDANFNNESNTELQQHTVLLKDDEKELLLLGFEDIRRDVGSCDQDFNDTVFYATTAPYTAIITDDIEEVDTPQDADGDGVTDQFDDYPENPDLAYDNYYPEQGSFNTLVFEDLWPHKGDYDFNDLVVDYNFNQITNADNLIARVDGTLVVKAIGAGFHNGFGIELPILPVAINSVTGNSIIKSYITTVANGTETGLDNAVIIIFDDAFNILPHPGGGDFVNTTTGAQNVTPNEINVSFDFTNLVSMSDMGTPPYNPFLIANMDKGKEVHLANYPPTSLVDVNLLGTGTTPLTQQTENII